MPIWGWVAVVVGGAAIAFLLLALTVAVVNVRRLANNLPRVEHKSPFEWLFDEVSELLSFVFMGRV